MKHLFILIISLFFYSSQAYANQSSQALTRTSNVSQQTGGNYIYAEHGKLTFNLEPSLFENRTWQYSSQTDSAVVGFEMNLPLKTKNASEFHTYELTTNSYHLYEFAEDGTYRYIRTMNMKQEPYGLVKPVYKPSMNGGKTVEVWLPAVTWGVRIIGAIARQVLPPLVTRCLSNAKCASFVASTAITSSIFCLINYKSDSIISRKLHLPKTVCDSAEKKGFKKSGQNNHGENDPYRRDYPLTVKGYHGNRDLHRECPACINDYREFEFGVESEEEAIQKLQAKCSAYRSFEVKDEWSKYDGLSGDVVSVELRVSNASHKQGAGWICSGIAKDENNEEFPFSAFFASIHNEKYSDTLQIHDVNDLIIEDFKSNPTPYINDTGEVGKGLRDSIQSSAQIVKKDGTDGKISASSNPYIDPETGETKQDIITIDSGKSDFTLPPLSSGIGGGGGSNSSGTGSNSGSGSVHSAGNSIPSGSNNVSVNTINRPDQTPNAKPAENNNPNGAGLTNPKNPAPSQSGEGQDDKPKKASGEKGGLDCKNEHKDTLACASLGKVSDKDLDGISIPEKTDNTNYQPDYFLPTNGACPAPKVFHVVGKQYQVSYEPICRIATDIRFAVLIAFGVMATLIAFGGLKKG